MASLSLYPQFEINLMSNRKVIELILQLKREKAHGKNQKSNQTWSDIFCVIVYFKPHLLPKLHPVKTTYSLSKDVQSKRGTLSVLERACNLSESHFQS